MSSSAIENRDEARRLSGSGLISSEEPGAAALMTDEEIAEEYCRLAQTFHARVLDHLSARGCIEFLEQLRGGRDRQLLRSYLTILGEYSAELDERERALTLDVLYDLLFHPDGDIRRLSGSTAGLLISSVRKHTAGGAGTGAERREEASLGELWKSFLHRMLFPGHLLPEQHRRWIGYSMKTVLRVLLTHTEGARQREVLRIFTEYFKSVRWDALTCFFLINCAEDIPFALCNDQQRQLILRFARSFLTAEDPEIRAAALSLSDTWLSQGARPDSALFHSLGGTEEEGTAPSCIRYLERRLLSRRDASCAPVLTDYNTAELYLENQKTEVPWIYKLINLEILRRKAEEGLLLDLFQYVSHLLHLLQFADRVVCRLQAGADLVAAMPALTETQKQEVLLELLSTVELGSASSAHYLPPFIGEIFLTLPTGTCADILRRLSSMADSSDSQVVIQTYAILGVILQRLPGRMAEAGEGSEEAAFLRELIKRAERILFGGIADYRREVAQEAFYVIGHELFGSRLLTQEGKQLYFSDMGRRVLAFMNWSHVDLFYFNAAGLGCIRRFLEDCIRTDGHTPACTACGAAAFFPGTFDPFSLGHRAIVEEIAALGFTVFLAVDEFSWSKKTQPYRIRRKIAAMSVADLPEVYLFPASLPVNIANPADLRRLRKVFGDREVYLVAGSDVIEHASAYKMPPEEGSVHSFPHILFARNEEMGERSPRIHAEVIRLRLPAYFETMSSTRIREYAGAGKDIGSLVVRRVQSYISERSLYASEPLFKKAAHSLHIDTVLTGQEQGLLKMRRLDLLHGEADPEICGSITFGTADTSDLYRICGDVALAQKLRGLVSGRLAVIRSISGGYGSFWDYRLTALNEAMALCQAEGCSYALCFREDAVNPEILALSGFRSVPEAGDCCLCDLRRPLVLLNDTNDTLRDLSASDPGVRRTIWDCHRRLLEALAGLYPGSLILSFDSEILNHRMIRLITKSNPVPEVQYTEKRLGSKMCVPFSKILKGVLIPDCVTKDLNTEKLYEPDLKTFAISSFPQDLPLDIQIRTIRSFGRPVILVDDIFHKGYRMQAVEPVWRKEGVDIDRLVVGVLSGRGRDLAREQNRIVDAVYFVPNMRSWMIESELYPFIGGDGVRRPQQEEYGGCLPSVNQTLPYRIPSYLDEASMSAFYHLSEVCLENAAAICKTLEETYRQQCGRKLTIERLGEMIAVPRIPDGVLTDGATEKNAPSELLIQEQSRLARFRHLLDVRFRL